MAFSPELFSTTAVRGGVAPDPATGAVLTPIYQSTTYHQQAVGVHKGFTYSRAANPTVSALEAALGALEDTPPAVCFATGMAAISTLFLAILKVGDHVVVSDVVYGGTVRLFQQVLDALRRRGVLRGHLGPADASRRPSVPTRGWSSSRRRPIPRSSSPTSPPSPRSRTRPA